MKEKQAYLPSLKLTASLPLKSYRALKNKDDLPTIHFLWRAVSFREGYKVGPYQF